MIFVCFNGYYVILSILINYSDGHLEDNIQLPGGRLLHRAGHHRLAMSDRLASINGNPVDSQYMTLQSTQIGKIMQYAHLLYG